MEEIIKEAEKEITQTDLEKRADEISQGRSGEELETKKPESPIEEARRLNSETKMLMGKIEEKAANMDNMLANLMMMGRGEAGQENKPITQADKDKAEAEKMLAGFR